MRLGLMGNGIQLAAEPGRQEQDLNFKYFILLELCFVGERNDIQPLWGWTKSSWCRTISCLRQEDILTLFGRQGRTEIQVRVAVGERVEAMKRFICSGVTARRSSGTRSS